MKHLKDFDSIVENLEESDVMDPTGEMPVMEPIKDESLINADSWVASANEEGDYDVTWKNENGEEVTASFKDMGGPIQDGGDGVGFSDFETIPGTSSDGKEYAAEVRYKEGTGNSDNVFLITNIAISSK
jgi:hypothetical protein